MPERVTTGDGMTTQAGLYIEQLKETIKAQQAEIEMLKKLLDKWGKVGKKGTSTFPARLIQKLLNDTNEALK